MKNQRLYNTQTSGSIGCADIAVKPLLGAWAGLSLLTFLATWAIQVIVLGMVFPDWGTAEGLLAGHDSVRFYSLAVERFELIRGVGWSAWELRPESQTIAGVMSAWFVITMPHPLVWAVLQSVVYGLGGAALFMMLQTLVNDWRWALIAVVIVLFLPSAAMIYSLPHHDAFVFAGFMLFVWGWSLLFRRSLGAAVAGVLLAAGGFGLMTLFRPFLEHIFLVISAVLLLGYVGFVLLGAVKSRAPAQMAWVVVPVVMLLAIAYQAPDSEIKPPSGEAKTEASVVLQPSTETGGWQRAMWLPNALDDRLKQLANARDRVIFQDGHGRSSIDLNVQFNSITDVIEYLPRAIQIGFFSPFLSQWLPHPDAPTNRQVERVVAGAEMTIIYLVGLPALVLAIWHWRREPLVWIVLVATGIYIVVYALAFPVVGALVRYRFPAFALLFGIAAVYLLNRLAKARR